MKTKLVIVIQMLAVIAFAQKKVLLEEFSGAKCGNCPMGSYYVDSMSAKYPNLIPVSLHSYQPVDAMNFNTIDTISFAYALGAPLGAIDRINPGGASTNVGRYYNQWDAKIQNRLAVASSVSLSISPSWNASGRVINSTVTGAFTSNLPTGDYRIGLYVVEDSVIGSTSGYHQVNFFDGLPGNPFFGQGDPIVGFVHRHVARAKLPTSWSLNNLLPSTPVIGQTFSHAFSYTVPAAYNENKMSVVAFVWRNSTNHQTDEVLNAQSAKIPVWIISRIKELNQDALSIYPNPAKDFVFIKSDASFTFTKIQLFSIIGQVSLTKDIQSTNDAKIDLGSLEKGIYTLVLTAATGDKHRQRLIVDK